MSDVRVRVQDAFIDDLRRLLRLDTNTQVVQDALTLLNWAAQERRHGRLVVSTNEGGDDVVRIALRSLDSVKQE